MKPHSVSCPYFKGITGNEKVQELLSQLLANKRVPHLLLFSGPEGIGKKLFAQRFAAAWMGGVPETHPDIHFFGVQGTLALHTIDVMKKAIHIIEHTPYSAERKTVIIDDAHRMLPASANALLKTLEEPPQDTLIILITTSAAKLLPTIISRAQQIRFCPLREHSFEKTDEFLRYLMAPTFSFAQALELCSTVAKTFEERKKEIEALVRSEYAAATEMNAQQKAQLEAEIEGASSLTWMREFDLFLHSIYILYRDLWLIGLGYNKDFNTERREFLEQYYQRGTALSLEEVEAILSKTRLSVERSVSVQAALEMLMITLKSNTVKELYAH